MGQKESIVACGWITPLARRLGNPGKDYRTAESEREQGRNQSLSGL
jgi:hypothetical protein